MAFSRQRLAEMGIDLWVSRQARTENVSTSIWHDAATTSISTRHNVTETSILAEQHNPVDLVELAANTTALNPEPISSNAVVDESSAPKPSAQKASTQKAAIQKASVQTPSSTIPSAQTGHTEPEQHAPETAMVGATTDSWHLELCVLEHVVLMVDASTLNIEQRQLWQNILTSLNGNFAQLQWPSAFRDWQDARGVAFYLAGFLAVHAAQKTQLLLGNHAVLEMMLQATPMPSLAEMLQQPLTKKQLWQQIRECNNSSALLQ